MNKKELAEIEKELDSYEFEDDNLFFTRSGMRDNSIKQRKCFHNYHPIGYSQGDFFTGIRCRYCGKQKFY